MRKIAWILIAAMIIIIVSCTQPETISPDNDVYQDEMTDSPETEVISDDLPNERFDGREFRILTCDYCKADYYSEEQSGALINDAVYNRNLTIEDRFNVKLSVDGDESYTNVSNKLSSVVLADDNAYDLVIQHQISLAQLASNNFFYNWSDIKYINIDKPWWNTSSYEDLSITGKNPMLTGSISPYYLGSIYCVYFNKRLSVDYGITDSIYDMTLDGNFTIDYYQSLIKDKWIDLNGNNTQDESDFYGLAAQVSSYATPYIYSFGEITVEKDKDGIPYLAMDNEKFSDIVDKIYTLYYESNATITTTGWDLHRDTFLDSRALFFNGVLSHSYTNFTDFNDDYGILPYPKWDESQDKYYTMSDGSAPLIAVPVTVDDTDFTGIITEALAAESWKTVLPTIYEVALKIRGTRDERSIEVIDIITNSVVFDLGFVYANHQGMGFTLSNLMSAKNNNYSSFYAANSESWVLALENIVEAYQEN